MRNSESDLESAASHGERHCQSALPLAVSLWCQWQAEAPGGRVRLRLRVARRPAHCQWHATAVALPWDSGSA